jgi:hypothetical protein
MVSSEASLTIPCSVTRGLADLSVPDTALEDFDKVISVHGHCGADPTFIYNNAAFLYNKENKEAKILNFKP